MARSVTITTSVPTLEEFGDSLGLSRASQRSLAPLFIERNSEGGYVVRRRGANRASAVVSTQREAVERAREIAPKSQILIERVRDTAVRSRERWRKP